MATNTTNRREFLKKAGIVGAAVTLGGLAEPVMGVVPAFAATGEPTTEIINYALTAEQLATTFYYTALHHGRTLPMTNNQDNQPYIRAALDEEFYHATLLSNAGAVSVAGIHPKFYFPNGTFANDSTFVAVLEALETAFIEAYLAGIYQFATNGRNDLAVLAGQIMGIEAEHRVLGRVILNKSVPNNLSLEQAPPSGSTVASVAKALVPFLSKGKHTDGPYALPTDQQIVSAVAGVRTPNN
ncbi:MAG: ferritin-like domain-containing protein [Firmicutes bacterium]|nr:ferritin-like domain-containing protein [Bacillota bacterium]